MKGTGGGKPGDNRSDGTSTFAYKTMGDDESKKSSRVNTTRTRDKAVKISNVSVLKSKRALVVVPTSSHAKPDSSLGTKSVKLSTDQLMKKTGDASHENNTTKLQDEPPSPGHLPQRPLLAVIGTPRVRAKEGLRDSHSPITPANQYMRVKPYNQIGEFFQIVEKVLGACHKKRPLIVVINFRSGIASRWISQLTDRLYRISYLDRETSEEDCKRQLTSFKEKEKDMLILNGTQYFLDISLPFSLNGMYLVLESVSRTLITNLKKLSGSGTDFGMIFVPRSGLRYNSRLILEFENQLGLVMSSRERVAFEGVLDDDERAARMQDDNSYLNSQLDENEDLAFAVDVLQRAFTRREQTAHMKNDGNAVTEQAEARLEEYQSTNYCGTNGCVNSVKHVTKVKMYHTKLGLSRQYSDDHLNRIAEFTGKSKDIVEDGIYLCARHFDAGCIKGIRRLRRGPCLPTLHPAPTCTGPIDPCSHS